jgi:hypothetical protein
VRVVPRGRRPVGAAPRGGHRRHGRRGRGAGFGEGGGGLAHPLRHPRGSADLGQGWDC